MSIKFFLVLSVYFYFEKTFGDSTDSQSTKHSHTTEWMSIKATGNLYYVSHVALEWVDALKFCARTGAHLLSLETRREEMQVLEIIKNEDKKKYEYWTSGSNAFKKDSFIWTANGENFKGNYHNFCDNNAYSETNQCLTATDKQNCWQARSCNSLQRFICELTVNMFVEELQ